MKQSFHYKDNLNFNLQLELNVLNTLKTQLFSYKQKTRIIDIYLKLFIKITLIFMFIYFKFNRIYRHKFLILMVAGTWLAAFGTLIPTWRGKWGRFGLDASIGSCTIIPVNGEFHYFSINVKFYLLTFICFLD